MGRSFVIFWLSACFVSLVAASTSSSSFTLAQAYLSSPSGFKTNNNFTFHYSITDPKTSTTTSCSTSWSATGAAPQNWISCTDTTFSFMFNEIDPMNGWALGLKHQYSGLVHDALKLRSIVSIQNTQFSKYNTSNRHFPFCSFESMDLVQLEFDSSVDA
ncbi:hypothetical protein MBLNU459_g2840t2 [Dothideomycetes sp. NU459]